ncbi:hypothetical protein Brms1b_005783 [Colletotrichum noveboracense]|nr:hypothetical protein Brms1b_005783 [Colletotrichum noveboracense]
MENMRGYFHTYRANRDLKLLYIDGMAAGKTDMGTLDTQDFLLRGVVDQPKFGEFERAGDICALVKSWGLDGVIRMEIGFESIYCDFTDGLDLVSVLRRPWSEDWVSARGMPMFDWLMYPRDEYDVDVKGMVGDAKERCVRQYLAPAEVVRDEWTVEDGLIHAAVETVLERICGDLYSARGLLVDAAPKLAAAFSAEAMSEAVDGAGGELGKAVGRARGVMKGLKEYLNWSGWKKCRPGCAVDEVCFVAMWPFAQLLL